jgi:hypothetical protein
MTVIWITNTFTCENRDGYLKNDISVFGKSNLQDTETNCVLITCVYEYVLILTGMVNAQSWVANTHAESQNFVSLRIKRSSELSDHK